MAVNRRLVSGMCLLAGLTLAGYTRFFWARSYMPSRTSIARLGRQLPPLPAYDTSGREVDIGKAALGSKSIVVFHSASCPVCREVLPELRSIPASLKLILVSEEAGNTPAGIESSGLGDAILLQDRKHVLLRSFPMSGVPTLLFVDERGVLRGGLAGRHSPGLVQRRSREFAEGRP